MFICMELAVWITKSRASNTETEQDLTSVENTVAFGRKDTVHSNRLPMDEARISRPIVPSYRCDRQRDRRGSRLEILTKLEEFF